MHIFLLDKHRIHTVITARVFICPCHERGETNPTNFLQFNLILFMHIALKWSLLLTFYDQNVVCGHLSFDCIVSSTPLTVMCGKGSTYCVCVLAFVVNALVGECVVSALNVHNTGIKYEG
jgi:hypothetical protein